MLNTEALKIKQKGVDIYITAMRIGDFADTHQIDRWSKDKQSGYQRALADNRIASAMKYLLLEDGIYPTSVLLNVRGEVRFKKAHDVASNIEFGTLAIPNESLPMYIVDGQHRIASLKEVARSPYF
jgi:DGQHR domain-containing protein